MAKGNTLESQENLENAGDLLGEFEKEYGRDNRDIRRQKKAKNDRNYWRGEFSGLYAARRLFGWSDREYDWQYWQRLEQN